MQFSSSDFLRLFFSELERIDIPYVILHSYDRFPEHIPSDVDFAVRTRDLSKLASIQSGLGERYGWRLAHGFESHVYAYYSVIIDAKDPRSFLQMDACSHYVEGNCFFLKDTVLLKDRRRLHDFYVPAPAVEFSYLLAKACSKSQPLEPRLARLRELWEREPSKIEEQFQNLCGTAQGTLGEWFARPPSQWETLRQALLTRNRFGLGDRVREGLRALNRVRRPAGLHLALLGPDGCGKSTLLERLGPLLEVPFFRRQLVFHFRPKVFEKRENDAPVTNPHEKPPRSRIAGLAKLVYYFLDNLAGYITKVFPAKARNELIIFCRSFDDLLIDPRRYRFHSAGWPARLLYSLLPRPDLTFVLDAEPEQIHARKPELSLEEIRRQRDAFKRLASNNPRYVIVCSAQPPDEVARAVCCQVIEFMAQRQKRRD